MSSGTNANVAKYLEAISEKKAVIGVVGLGYVGLPLVLEYCDQGFNVVGFDVDDTKVNLINDGKSAIKHISSERVNKARSAGRLEATSDFKRIGEVDSILICVPTPLTEHRDPDLSYIEKTAESIGPFLRNAQLVTLESTTYPGTTRDVMIPILEVKSGLKAGEDFWVAYSPEREDPNNPNFNTATIPKVVGGFTEDCKTVAVAMYDQIVERTVPVSSCEVAESTKLLENIFRSINIAMVNELKMIFHRMDINVWEVIEAASTKPFGYMPFFPGPGLGGHCIPIDPFYLTWKAKEFGLNTRFIELAGEINTSMPDYVIHRCMEELNNVGKPLRGSKVLLIGMAYKANVDDMRESPSLVLTKLLEASGAVVDYHDPYIPVIPRTRSHAELAGRESVDLASAGDYDLVLIATNHKEVDYDLLREKYSLIVDTRNVFADDFENVKRS